MSEVQTTFDYKPTPMKLVWRASASSHTASGPSRCVATFGEASRQIRKWEKNGLPFLRIEKAPVPVEYLRRFYPDLLEGDE